MLSSLGSNIRTWVWEPWTTLWKDYLVTSEYLVRETVKVSFSNQVQQEQHAKKQYENSIRELNEKKESLKQLRLKTQEVHQEVQNEENILEKQEKKMKLHYESKIKILDIKVFHHSQKRFARCKLHLLWLMIILRLLKQKERM